MKTDQLAEIFFLKIKMKAEHFFLALPLRDMPYYLILISSSIHNSDILFYGNNGIAVFGVDGSANSLFMYVNKKIELGHADENIYGDGTDIHFGVGSGGDINIPTDIGLTFGSDDEIIEGDGTNLTIKGGYINLISEGDVTFPLVLV